MQWLAGLLLALNALQAVAAPAMQAPAPTFVDAVNTTRAAIGDHRLVLLGEYHGTREIPQYVAALIESLSNDGGVTLAVEISRSEQAALDQFLASDGGQDALAQLQATPWWSQKGTRHDLRRSRDMFELFQRLQQLRAEGHQVNVCAIDLAAGVNLGSQQRDQEMAASLRECYVASTSSRVLVLVGNVHAMLSKPANAPKQMQQPMGSYLADLDPYSIRLSASEGEFWGCAPDCKPISLMPGGEQGAWRGPEYHYLLVLPKLSVARFLDAP